MKIYFGRGFCGRKRLIKKLFLRTLEITGNEVSGASVNINFVTNDEIRNLNKTYRQVDRVTDVLSFPMLDISQGQNLSDYLGERLPNGELALGDIALCKDKIKSQAKEYGHSYKRELAYLIVHGFLHLLGYDHIEKEQESVMTNLTENVLLNVGLERREKKHG